MHTDTQIHTYIYIYYYNCSACRLGNWLYCIEPNLKASDISLNQPYYDENVLLFESEELILGNSY